MEWGRRSTTLTRSYLKKLHEYDEKPAVNQFDTNLFIGIYPSSDTNFSSKGLSIESHSPSKSTRPASLYSDNISFPSMTTFNEHAYSDDLRAQESNEAGHDKKNAIDTDLKKT